MHEGSRSARASECSRYRPPSHGNVIRECRRTEFNECRAPASSRSRCGSQVEKNVEHANFCLMLHHERTRALMPQRECRPDGHGRGAPIENYFTSCWCSNPSPNTAIDAHFWQADWNFVSRPRPLRGGKSVDRTSMSPRLSSSALY